MNRWKQQAPLFYFYWNCAEQQRRRWQKADDNFSSEMDSSEQKDWSEPKKRRHISPPSIIYITTAMATPQPQQSSSGRRAGTFNYGIEETKQLFEIMEKILPIGTDEWTKVVDEHSIKYPGRTVLSIRRRYQNLHRKQAPTGSPNMPDDVRQAKRIKYKIGKKAELSDGTEEFTLEDGFQKSNENDEDGIELHETAVDSPATGVVPPLPTAARSVPVDESTITPTKRSYNSRVSSPFPGGDRFLQSYQLSLQQDRISQEREARRWERERIERKEAMERDRMERKEAIERDRIERQEARKARDDMMKMLGIAVSQFANAMATNSNNVSAVFRPGQAPRFENMNGDSVSVPLPPPEDEEDE